MFSCAPTYYIEVRFESFIDWIVCGSFDFLYNILSNLYKFVSLSLYPIELYVWDLAFEFACRGLYDVAFALVTV